jgi:hypothetical protein
VVPFSDLVVHETMAHHRARSVVLNETGSSMLAIAFTAPPQLPPDLCIDSEGSLHR